MNFSFDPLLMLFLLAAFAGALGGVRSAFAQKVPAPPVPRVAPKTAGAPPAGAVPAKANAPANASALGAPDAAAGGGDEGGVLNFEAEIIDGERKRPDLFLQIGTQKQTMEAVIYSRKDFNDFHKGDAGKRPSYIDTRSGAKPVQGSGVK
jgi:hypothetical protein